MADRTTKIIGKQKKYDSLLAIAFTFFILAIPFQTRIFLADLGHGLEGNEYSSAWLWGTDILLAAVAFLIIARQSFYPAEVTQEFKKSLSEVIVEIFLLGFLITIVTSLAFAANKHIAAWTFIKFLELFILFFIPRFLKPDVLFKVLAVGMGLGAIAQSLIALLQFKFQSDLGLRLLGESPLGMLINGVAKMHVAGATVIRVYGTTPHPNVLAAYLAVAVLIINALLLNYLKDNRDNKRAILIKIIFGSFLLLSFFALALSGSRAVWVGLLAGETIFFGFLIAKYFHAGIVEKAKITIRPRSDVLRMIIFTISVNAVAAVLVLLALFPFIVPRVSVAREEQAVGFRLFYNQTAIELIEAKPLVGVGPGDFVENIGQPTPRFKLKDWVYQPAHNIYLLIAAENGLISLFIFICLVLSVFYRTASKIKNLSWQNNNFVLAAGISLGLILFVGFFDHFSWTLQQGRLLFWLLLGILASHGLKDKRFGEPS
ncbi:MAG: hypothetical protein A3A80_02055 [Candidatus Terrybacteria bacterium RIFCSPLOWO2_01_FULL_44_24]|uniref:O-antigen ligase-related domain-containing protein n=1 Tax=Candidatus Terrybacteria bacterium RIFCSPHIGHO2_01_FULL_43_35 TaxID=1802361 RepID=A0A1G2PE64_9BACT|nr:MAG: hypothetical protein A2828_01845 [Candidatus Terrybacteria bacterium RIFCSPHIGHO2_01_FULL_43_35]OHA50864.1 MAG: hypothetical protein A3A80_02055 [Candidatus Terrybacteria bacterium RIFCSPLOWO2_01_FULL_44_24]